MNTVSRKELSLKSLLENQKTKVGSRIFVTSPTTKNSSRRRSVKKRKRKSQQNGNAEVLEHKVRKCSTKNKQDSISSNSDTEINSENDNLIPTSPDSALKVNLRKSDDWKRKSTNISPSKSEFETSLEINQSVDVVYHANNEMDNEMFSSSDETYSDYLPDIETFLIPTLQQEKNVAVESPNRFYNMHNGKIMILKAKEKIYFQGTFKLSVLSGCIELLGYEISPSKPEIEVYSLRGFSYLYIQNTNMGCFASSNQGLRDILAKRHVVIEDINEIFSNLESDDTIIACSNLQNFKMPYIEKHISQKLLSIEKSNLPIVIKENIDELNVLKINLQWDKIIENIHKDSKLMLCGGKGVGKSTLLRYMINKLLMNYVKVLVIDLDPGQSEFTIPGCVSAVIIEKPIFGANFTHLNKPERCIFVDNIDISLKPEAYIECVIKLLQQCEDLVEIPTLINYMGYAHNYGINIVSTVITHVRPTIVLQINSDQEKKNYTVDLTPDVVNQYCDIFGAKDQANLRYKFKIVESMCDKLSSWQAQGRSIREMCVLAYFSHILDNSLSLTSGKVPTYEIEVNDITLIDSKYREIENKLGVFNASLVGLCSKTDASDIYNCHGWGIVRGVTKDTIVVITPVSEEDLQTVTHLVKGTVAIPPSVLISQDEGPGLIPYVSPECASTVYNIPKRSYLPKKT